MEAGMSLQEAGRRARRIFGGLDQIKQECRDARGISLLEMLLQDARYALRMLRFPYLLSLVFHALQAQRTMKRVRG
jgi:hypothetical protein